MLRLTLLALLAGLFSALLCSAATAPGSQQGSTTVELDNQVLRDILQSRQMSKAQLIQRATRTRAKRQNSPRPLQLFYLKTADGRYLTYTYPVAPDVYGTVYVGTTTRPASGSTFVLDSSGRWADSTDTIFASYAGFDVTNGGLRFEGPAQQAAIGDNSLVCTLSSPNVTGGSLSCKIPGSANPVAICNASGYLRY